MKYRFLTLICACISLSTLALVSGCNHSTNVYPVSQIRFYVDDSLYDAVIVRGNSFVMPNAPQKEGYEFMGWYCDSAYTTAFKADKYAINRSRYDIDVYAKFEKISADNANNPSIYQVLCQT